MNVLQTWKFPISPTLIACRKPNLVNSKQILLICNQSKSQFSFFLFRNHRRATPMVFVGHAIKRGQNCSVRHACARFIRHYRVAVRKMWMQTMYSRGTASNASKYRRTKRKRWQSELFWMNQLIFDQLHIEWKMFDVTNQRFEASARRVKKNTFFIKGKCLLETSDTFYYDFQVIFVHFSQGFSWFFFIKYRFLQANWCVMAE